MVMEAIAKNGNWVDAILAPNDKLAGTCIEALRELGITEPRANRYGATKKQKANHLS